MGWFNLRRYLAVLANPQIADWLFEATKNYFAVLSWLTATALLSTIASVAIRCQFFLAPLATLPVITGYLLILSVFITGLISEARQERSARKFLNPVLLLVTSVAIAFLWLFTAYGWALGGVISKNVCASPIG
ncbi:MAG: hypothetical protein AAFX52_03055 [Pseudomonadota bacterium]